MSVAATNGVCAWHGILANS